MDLSIPQLAEKYPTVKALLDQYREDRVQLAIEENLMKSTINSVDSPQNINENKAAELRARFIKNVEYEVKQVVKECSNGMNGYISDRDKPNHKSSKLSTKTHGKGSLEYDLYEKPSWMTDSCFLFARRISNKKTDLSTNCKGCGLGFKRNGPRYELAYYVHCIEECIKYEALNLIRTCVCGSKFINPISLAKHQNTCNQLTKKSIPPWMSLQIPQRAAIPGTIGNTTIACLGCQKPFEKNKYAPELAYYIHCMEECPDYKALGMIRACKCGKKFLNLQSSENHARTCPFDYEISM